MTGIILKNEWRQFTRNKAMIAAMVLIFCCGIYAIQYGNNFNARQLNILNGIDTSQASKEKKYLTYYDADTTSKESKKYQNYTEDAYMSDWFTQKPLYKKPTQFAALSVGQNDNQPYYYKAWMMNNVYNNKLQEITNPDKLLAGNFDLSFVLLYLFPLFIIAFGYNTLSNEKENGTYTLLKVQAKKISTCINAKLLFQFLMVSSIATILIAVAVIWNGISFTKNYTDILSWWIISQLYLLFWITCVYALISFGSSSSINALSLVSCWVLFLLFIPATVNYFIQFKYPENERLSMIKASRTDNTKLSDMPRQIKIDSFYSMYPKYKVAAITDTNFVDIIAYVEISQQHTNAVGRQNDSTILQRLQTALSANIINPVFAVQYSYNQIAQSEINHFGDFRKQVASFQQKRRHYIFDNMLSGKPFTKEGYKNYPAYTAESTQNYKIILWPILVWIALLSLIGFLNFKKI